MGMSKSRRTNFSHRSFYRQLNIDNLAIPASVISKGQLSDLQLEAVVYGCQRHQLDLPQLEVQREKEKEGSTAKEEESPTSALKESNEEGTTKRKMPYRCGFLLGDGAGMVGLLYPDFHLMNELNCGL